MPRKTLLVRQIMGVLEGQAYIEQPLQDYHAATDVKHAMRRRHLNDRLIGVREALRKHRVTAWATDDGRIELRKAGVAALTLGTPSTPDLFGASA